jgi:hypothetical protein
MRVLIGVDPHKASIAVAVVDEATSELRELRRKYSVCRESLTTGRLVVVFHPHYVCPQSH